MPELPEVETTKNGLIPHLLNNIINEIKIHYPSLRYPIPKKLIQILENKKVIAINRRAKYLLIEFDCGSLLIHLGMSGSLKVLNKKEPLIKHDHFEIIFKNNQSLRLNDPRRFGFVLWQDDKQHQQLKNLAPEPLSEEFNNNYLFPLLKNKNKSIKGLIMEQKFVVGVGNIYASESLFLSKINPTTKAKDISKKQSQLLIKNIKTTLEKAIKAGGTTLKDFSNIEGKAGYFSQELKVYGRENKHCFLCNDKIFKIQQHGRATFYCPSCQK
ncbi:Formamidopyrimidine-DNA glycosylase [hydrothermal vent metagenome]|uniref:Formamidopyrimidine-DNA glycosylase n=1 Tax=hydrothermal vent metagenome TaxID=652676 RepID=A0A1W1BUK3_9ZZZZ